MKKELNESKSQVLVAEYKREHEIQHQDIRAQEEIASLQQLVHGKELTEGKRKVIDQRELCLQRRLKSRAFPNQKSID